MKLIQLVRSLLLGTILIVSLSGCAVAARVLTAVNAIPVIDSFIESVPREQPRGAPPVGTAAGVQALVSGTKGVGLRLNGQPGAERLLVVPEGTTVTVLCYTSGPSVSGPYGATAIWNHVRTPSGSIGYMSAAYLNARTDGPVVPAC